MNCIKTAGKKPLKTSRVEKKWKTNQNNDRKVKLMISLHSGSNIREQHWRAIDQISKSTLTDRVYKRQ